ncbi:quinone oxidoreductase family protein [Shewanella mangrovi]|nr:zinc-binding alcohol dehydrogenase family protein [Shewanella mangrovi]
MQALVVTQFGETPAMQIETRVIPQAKPGYSLLKMHAATVNPLSNQIRLGAVPTAQAPLVLSNDGSGTVVSSEKFTDGQQVAVYGGGSLGITEDGLQQEYALVANKWIVPLPEGVSLDDAAALPINYVSAYQAIHRVGQLQPGQVALVSGATGSLGHALIQLINVMGAVPIAIVSTSAKVANAARSGAHAVIDLSAHNLIEQAHELTNGKGADFAFDTVAGELLGPMLKSLKTRGTLVAIGFAGGVTPAIDIVDVVVHEKKLLGFDAHLETDADVATTFDELNRLLVLNKIKPRIDSKFPLAEYHQAYSHLMSRKAQGTILLTFNSSQE